MSLDVSIGYPQSHGAATVGNCSNYTGESLYVLGTRAYSSSTGYGSRSITVLADKAIKRVRLTGIISSPIYDLFKSPEPVTCGGGAFLRPSEIYSNGDNGASYPRVVIYDAKTWEEIGNRSWYTWSNITSDKFYVDIYNGKYTSNIVIEYRIPYCNGSKSTVAAEYTKMTATVRFYKNAVTEEKFDFVDTSINYDIAFNNVKTLHGYKCIPDKNVSISYYAESEVTPTIQLDLDNKRVVSGQTGGNYTYNGVVNSDSFREITAKISVSNSSTQGSRDVSVYTHYPIEIRSVQGRITKCKLEYSVDCITEYKNAPPSNYMSPTITSVLGISNIINDYANKRYTYTVSASKCGKYPITVDIEDNLDNDDKRHATDKQYIQVYQPPTSKISVDDDTPDIGQTITFTNDSVEAEGSTCKYDWYINRELKYSDKSKDFSLNYDVESPNEFLVSIEGYDTAEPSETKSSNAIHINPNSPIPDFRVRCETSLVYASIPATFYIDTKKRIPEIVYTWEINNIPKGTGDSIVYTPTDTGELSVTATATYLGVTESNTYSTTVQSPAPLIAFTYSPTENIIRGFTDVTLDNESAPVEETTPTYTWYVNDSVVVPVDNKIKLYNETNKIKLTGTVSGFSSSYETDPIPTISPAPTLNLTLSKDSASIGDTVTCNSNIVPLSGTTVQIRWYINNVPVESYNNQDVIDYIVPDDTHSDIIIRVEAWATSSPGDTSESSKTLRIVRYKSPIDRFVVCIYNDNVKEDEFTTHKITDQLRCFTRDSSSSDRYTNLSFETRLNETGNGSLDILINKTTEDDTLLTSGNSIVIFDDFLPVYTGVITSVSNTNICVSGKSDIMKKEMYTIKFDEGCRKLSYIQSTKSKTIVGSLATLCNELIPEKYLGEIKSSDSITYSFSISYQDILSQIDSLGEQYNVRYRTRPKSYGTWYSDMTFNVHENKPIITLDKGEFGVPIPKGTLVCGYLQSQFLLARVTSDFGERANYAEIQLLIPVPSSLLRKKFDGVSFFSNESIIDIKDTYYENESIFPVNEECKSDNKKALIINKTCLDVSDVDNLNKHYGSISVSSPQFNKPNKVCSMKLTVPYLKDNSIIQGWHLVNPFDYVIVDVAITDTQFLNILVKGDARHDMESLYTKEPDTRLYYISQITNNDGKNISELIPSFDKSTWEKIEKISDDGIKEVYTKLIGVPIYPPYDVDTYKNLIGKHMFSLYIPMEDNHTYPRFECEDAYIGGVLIKGKKERYEDYYKLTGEGRGSNPYVLDYILETTFGFSNNLLVLPQEPAPGSPYLLYPNKTLSVTVQSSMSYADLAVIASNIARLGSNFTATVTGTCNINKFVDKYDLFPSVGSHVALYYDDGSAVKIGSTDYNEYYHDYELQSYKVDTQKMTVDFNFGIKPINIGDVIYRLSQNMTTNIVNK